MTDFNEFQAPKEQVSLQISPRPQPISSGSKNIAAALAKAQLAIKQPTKNKTVTVSGKSKAGVPFSYEFEYADYFAIVEAVREPLGSNGIAFTHVIESRGDFLVLMTRLIHESGEVLESLYPLPSAGDAKDLGGAITYGKRYCLSAITGCVADDDLDAEPQNVQGFKSRGEERMDDISDVIPPRANNGYQIPLKPPYRAPDPIQAARMQLVTEAQVKRLYAIADQSGWTHDDVKRVIIAGTGLSSSKELSRTQYDELIQAVRTKSAATVLSEIETMNANKKV